jgi:hypothetical protein
MSIDGSLRGRPPIIAVVLSFAGTEGGRISITKLIRNDKAGIDPEDLTMGGSESGTPIPPDVMADLERAIEILMTGRRDPEFEARIHAQSEKITQEVLKKHGVLDIGVPAIRALRDGDDE